jgi:hypothetical protein
VLLVITQRLAHFTQAPRQLVIAGIPIGPHRLNQFIFADEPPAVFDQEFESLKSLWAQPYLFAFTQETTTCQI